MAAGGQQSVASNGLWQMRIDHVLQEPNAENLFNRSMKVFMTGFVGYEDINTNHYENMFQQFMIEMADLFGYSPPGPDFKDPIITSIENFDFIGTVSLIRLKGTQSHNWSQTKLYVTWGASGNQTYEDLTWKSDGHSHCQIMETFNMDLLIQLRTNNQVIVVSVRDPNVAGLSDIEINAHYISAEGYEEWFKIGAGVEVLVKITFEVNAEPNVTAEEINVFHYTFLKTMITKRLTEYRKASHPQKTGHRLATANKVKVSFLRSIVDPNTTTAYWPDKPVTSLDEFKTFIPEESVDSERSDIIKNLILRKTVPYCDLQIGVRGWHELADSCCLCSEWCNWNAFFHFNPIYRILMVLHNLWFMGDRVTVPEIYMLAITEVARLQSVPQPTEETPVFKLIYSVHNHQKRVINEVRLKSQKIRLDYRNSLPEAVEMTGLAYRSLRLRMRLLTIRQQLHSNPLSEVCIEDMQNYIDLMVDLHNRIGSDGVFVDPHNLKDFYKELSPVLANQYRVYVTQSYKKLFQMQWLNDYSDYVFNRDYEYAKLLAKDEEEEWVLQLRQSVTNLGTFDNPLNLKAKTNQWLSIFIAVHNVVTRVSVSTHDKEAAKKIRQLCKDFDGDFYTLMFTNNQQLDFSFPGQTMTRTRQRHIRTFYTLKMYYYMFNIQRFCVESARKVIGSRKDGSSHISQQYLFIWLADLETTHCAFSRDRLFPVDSDIDTTIGRFYDDLWPKAAHQTGVVTTINDMASSGYQEYQRLYYWWKNNGKDLKRFTNVLQALDDVLAETQESAEKIFRNEISVAMQELALTGDHNWVDIMDHLMYYLVKAICSVCLQHVMLFVNSIYQITETYSTITTSQSVPTQRRVNYPLTKPGWLEMFRTVRKVIDNFLNDLRIKFVVYDDHFNRISNTLKQTQRCLKENYKHIYNQLCCEWIGELGIMHSYPVTYANVVDLQILHLTAGFAFAAAFVDEFRAEFNHFRKDLWLLMKLPCHPNNQFGLTFDNCLPLCEQYLSDIPTVRRGQPFGNQVFDPIQDQIYISLNQLTAANVRIDLADADVP